MFHYRESHGDNLRLSSFLLFVVCFFFGQGEPGKAYLFVFYCFDLVSYCHFLDDSRWFYMGSTSWICASLSRMPHAHTRTPLAHAGHCFPPPAAFEFWLLESSYMFWGHPWWDTLLSGRYPIWGYRRSGVTSLIEVYHNYL